jgi:hypothetical protein
MNKLRVLTAFLFAIAAANQALACDMGAIETWVAAACQDNACETKSITGNSAKGCDGSIVPSVIPLCDHQADV